MSVNESPAAVTHRYSLSDDCCTCGGLVVYNKKARANVCEAQAEECLRLRLRCPPLAGMRKPRRTRRQRMFSQYD